MLSLLPLLLACGSVGTKGPTDTSSGTTATTTAGDSGLGSTSPDGGSSGGTDSGPVDDPVDDPVETIPDAEAPPLGMCHVTLDCETKIPDGYKILCAMTVLDSDGDVYWDGDAGVELRGRSSLNAPKHQYSVELWDAEGNEASANLLGMGRESDWVLNGNYYDRSLIRNPLAYDLFRAAGQVGSAKAAGQVRYAAEHRYCDLSLDGEWLGIYSLMERVKRDDDRLDIAADDGTGQSFILKLAESDYLHANNLGYGGWKVVYPSVPDASQQAGINAWLDGFELAATTSPDQLADWVDVDSTIDLILLEELFKNNDAYFLSLILWKDLDGVMQWTPWDLDLSLGQPSYNDNENPASWILYRPTMPAAFSGIDGFDARLVARWAELRAGPWATDQILARIDTYQATMGAKAIARNFDVWPIDEIAFGDYLYPVSSYAQEDAAVRAWVAERADWMDTEVGLWSNGP